MQEITFTNCSVTNSNISSTGSVGALIGHATGNAWGLVKATGITVTGNTIASTGTTNNKAGTLFGTIGVAGNESNGKTGGVYVYSSGSTVNNNTVTSNETSINRLFGRVGSNGGKFYVDDELVASQTNNTETIEKDIATLPYSA